jgi:hypothetical protein
MGRPLSCCRRASEPGDRAYLPRGGLPTMILYSLAKLWRLTEKCYLEVDARLLKASELLGDGPRPSEQARLLLVRMQPTAVILVGKRYRAGMQTLSWVQRQFPDRFRNFIFVGVGQVDAQNHASQEQMRRMRETIESSLRHYMSYCQRHGLAAEYRVVFAANPMVEFTKFTHKAKEEYPRATSFAGEVIFWQVNSPQQGRGSQQAAQ